VPCRAVLSGGFYFIGSGVDADKKQGLIERTLAVYQPRTKRTLSHEDAREIAANIVGLFQVLREWAAKDQTVSATADSKVRERSKPKTLPQAAGEKKDDERRNAGQ